MPRGIKPGKDEPIPEEIQKGVEAAFAEQYYPELFDELKEEIKKAIVNYIGTELPGRTFNFDIDSQFDISNDNYSGYIEIDVGDIEGSHEEHVRGHMRKGSEVQGYTRRIENQAAFETSDGIRMLNKIPDEKLKEIVIPIFEKWDINPSDVEFEE